MQEDTLLLDVPVLTAQLQWGMVSTDFCLVTSIFPY